jgi:hypothetical protein
MSDRARRILLALGDGLSLSLFAILGLLRHQEGITAAGVARNAGPILLGWYGAALALSLYRRPGIGRLVLTWAIGISAGVAIRAMILRRDLDGSSLAFWGVTMAVTLALLLTWRLLARALSLWSPGTSPSRRGSRSNHSMERPYS